MKKYFTALLLTFFVCLSIQLKAETYYVDSIKLVEYEVALTYQKNYLKNQNLTFQAANAALEDNMRYNASQSKYNVAYYNYYSRALDYTEEVFRWQLNSSRFIFLVVIMIVLSGLFFAGVQFYVSMKIALSPIPHSPTILPQGEDIARKNEVLAQLTPDTTLDFTKSGVQLKSSVMGIVILVISIAFFYLYLHYVYPVNSVDLNNSLFSKQQSATVENN